MFLICPDCSFHYALELDDGGHVNACPQCDAHPEILLSRELPQLRIACECCALGYLVSLTERPDPTCPGCGRSARLRDVELLGRCAHLIRARVDSGSERRSRPRCGDGRIIPGQVNLDEMQPPPAVLGLVCTSLAQSYNFVPVRLVRDRLLIATPDPERPGLLDDIEMLMASGILAIRARESDVAAALKRWYTPAPSSYEELVAELAPQAQSEPQRLIDLVFQDAVTQRAREIHFRAAHRGWLVYLIVGSARKLLHTVDHVPALAILRHLKDMFGMTSDDSRLEEGTAEWFGADGPLAMEGRTSLTDFGENFQILIQDTHG